MTAAIVLVGPRGSGKTTLGRRLAAHLGWAFCDADAELEARHGRAILEWLPADPEGFRRAEAELLGELLGRCDTVLALGGGVVEDEASVDALAARGRVVALTAAHEALVRRQGGGARPALSELPLADEVRTVLERRRPAYDRAAGGRWVDTTGDLERAWQRLLAAVELL